MKRLFALILALVMCLGLCACGGKSEFVGLYRTYQQIFVSQNYVSGGGDFLYCYKYINLNRDGTGNIYYEIETDNPQLRAEKKQAAMDKEKKDITWDTEDGYLIIYYTNENISTYEKKGVKYVNIFNENDIITKIS